MRCCYSNRDLGGERVYSAHNWRITKIIEIKPPFTCTQISSNKNVNELAVSTSLGGYVLSRAFLSCGKAAHTSSTHTYYEVMYARITPCNLTNRFPQHDLYTRSTLPP